MKKENIEQEHKKEISREKLRAYIDDHILNYNVQIEKLNKDISKVAGQGKKIEELPEWINDAKKEITTFTFELISMIIGFLSLMIAVVVLWVNKDGISIEMLPVYAALATAFIVLFAFFVGSWIIKNFNNNRSVE